MQKTSIFRSIILTATMTSLVILSVLLYILYRDTIVPIEISAKSEALELAQKEVTLRLAAKEESVKAIVSSLTRDPRIREGLRTNNQPLAYAGIESLRADFERLSPNQDIRAEVITRDQTLFAKSWDPTPSNERIPNLLAASALTLQNVTVSFGMGNTGLGIIGFAPVFDEGQLIGIVSVSQGIETVVQDLKREGFDWIVLLNIGSIRERFDGVVPPIYLNNPFFDHEHIVAHSKWFDISIADYIKQVRPDVGKQLERSVEIHDDRIIFDMPIYEHSGFLLGRSILVSSSKPVTDRIEEGLTSITRVIVSIITILLLVIAILLFLVRQQVIKPIDRMVDAITNVIRSGHFSNAIPITRMDELGVLTHRFNELIENLEKSITESNTVISEIAAGDFKKRVKGEYVGDLDNLKAGINAAAVKLKEQQDRVLQATQAKSQFLANMSHEIRTPINGVIGMLSLLEHSHLPDEQAEQVRLAQSSAELLLGLVNDILDFSKIEAGKMSIEHAPVNLHELLHNVTDIFQNAAKSKNVILELSLNREVNEYITGDSLRLRQVLNNLLSNALKFTEHGRVTLRATVENNCLKIGVKDTGIGMSPAVQKKLFQSFSQADSSTSRKYGGTGLGLKISRELVRLMGGDMQVASKEGVGSLFWLVIPYLPCKRPVEDQAGATKFLDYSRKRILLVEDNIVNQKLAVKLLEKFNIVPAIASNGQIAVEMVAKEHFHLILMDCQMPVMDGYTATKLLRQNDYRMPIAALTANATADDRKECIACGMNDFLAKPYNLNNLSRLLERWLT